MRVLILPRYGHLGASSRLRLFQYIPCLQAQGFQVEVSPLLGTDYLHGLYAGRSAWLPVIRAYVRRISRLLKDRKCDVIWVEKELFPWCPSWFAQALLPRRAKVVVDYDDAIFHNYDMHPSKFVRMLFGRKIDDVMKSADIVTAGNEYLAARARSAGCGQVELLPTVIDLERYPARVVEEVDRAELVVGWIGSPSTAQYLHRVARTAERLKATHAVRFVAIGARPDQVTGTPFEAVPWSESTEVAQLHRIDIGIMPLEDGPWERGKCGYKLIQYMACGLPVVASPVGVNQAIVAHGANGFLASTEEEWMQALVKLLEDESLRRTLGQAGRQRVEQTYCLQVQAPRLAGFLRSLVAT